MTVTSKSTGRRYRGVAWPAAMTLAGLVILISLGLWQLERRTWKQALIATLSERLERPPVALPPPSQWADLSQAQDEFRRVTFVAEFLHDREALIFTGPSALRPDATGLGYWVMTPARLSDGSIVMVNRGFVPEAQRDPSNRREGRIAGTVELTGVLRWPEGRGMFTPADSPESNLWYLRDHLAIAEAKGVAPAAPFYIDLEGLQPPGGLPRPGALHVVLPNNHLQYAITWFGLALALAAIFLIWAVRRTR